MPSSGYRIPKGKYPVTNVKPISFRLARNWHGRQGVSVFDVYNRRNAYKSKERHTRNMLVVSEHRAARMFTLGAVLEVAWLVWAWEPWGRGRVACLAKFKL